MDFHPRAHSDAATIISVGIRTTYERLRSLMQLQLHLQAQLLQQLQLSISAEVPTAWCISFQPILTNYVIHDLANNFEKP